LQKRIVELDASAPTKPVAPDTATDPGIATLREKIAQHKLQQQAIAKAVEEATKTSSGLAVEIDRGNQLNTAMETLERQITKFRSDWKGVAGMLALDIDSLLKVQINRQAVLDAVASKSSQRTQITDTLDARSPTSLPTQSAALATELGQLENRLDKPSRDYQETLKIYDRWVSARKQLTDGDPMTRGVAQVTQDLASLDAVPAKLHDLKAQRSVQVREIHRALMEVVSIYKELYQPARDFIDRHPFASAGQLAFGATLRERGLENRFWDIHGRHVVGTFLGADDGAAALLELIRKTDFSGEDDVVGFALEVDRAIHYDLRATPPKEVDPDRSILKGHKLESLYDLVFGLTFLEPYYILQSRGMPLDRLSPGQKGTLLLLFYLLLDPSRRPLLLDQPDENLDGDTINELLVPAIKEAKQRRQVVVITHNPNVAVVADADQVIVASMPGEYFEYECGAIERSKTNAQIVKYLEGTWPAFKNRGGKYQESESESSPSIELTGTPTTC
jgi:AAA domain, putative AbiEii toxin, Type IV TA system